jgi:DNA polymerase V
MKNLKLHTSNTLDIYSTSMESEIEVPFISGGISAGFPSPAMDFAELSIDLNKYLIKHESSTFLGRVKGESMKDANINDGDILIIDKGLEPCNGKIAVCFIDGEFTVKRIKTDKKSMWLVAENEKYKPIIVSEENNFIIWGIVTFIIKKI